MREKTTKTLFNLLPLIFLTWLLLHQTTKTTQTKSTSSTIVASNINITTKQEKTNQVTISGSNLDAKDNLNITTTNLNVKASKDIYSSKTNTKSIDAHASLSTSSGFSASLNTNNSNSKTTQTKYNHSKLNASTLNINTKENANIIGANINAKEKANLNIGKDLTLSSTQNISNSVSKSNGVSLSNSSGGYNNSLNISQSKTTNLSSITAKNLTINTKNNTNIKGALIAAGEFDSNGVFKDNANLQLKTKSLTLSNLNNTNYSNSKSSSLSLSKATSNISAHNTKSYQKSKTLATIGKGTIDTTSKIDSTLNRDTSKIDKSIYNVTIQKANVDATIDNRYFSEEGRKAIQEDTHRTKSLVKSLSDIATKDAFELQDTIEHIQEVQKDIDIQKEFALLDGGKYVEILDDKSRSKYSIKQRDEALNKYAQIYAKTYGVSIEEAKNIAIKKYYALSSTNKDKTTSSVYLNDNKINGALDSAKALGHEITHARIEQGKTRDRGSVILNEEYANTMGEYSSSDLEFSASSYSNINLNNNKPTVRAKRDKQDIQTLNTNTDSFIANSKDKTINPWTLEDIEALEKEAKAGNVAAQKTLQELKQGVVVEKDINDAAVKALKDPNFYKEVAKEGSGYNDAVETIEDIKDGNYAGAVVAIGSIAFKPLKVVKKEIKVALKGKKEGELVKIDGKTYAKRDGKVVEVVDDRPTRRKAFRDAKRDAGIPVSSQPYKTEKVNLLDSKTNKPIMDQKTGQPIKTNEYYFKNNKGDVIIIQDHKYGHDFGGKGNQEAHFNVRPSTNTKTGKVHGTKEHYEFKGKK